MQVKSLFFYFILLLVYYHFPGFKSKFYSYFTKQSLVEKGITHYSLLPQTPMSTIDSIIQTNLMAVVYSSRVVSRYMIKRGGGCIINISSVLAERGGKGSSVYASSKAGINGTECFQHTLIYIYIHIYFNTILK